MKKLYQTTFKQVLTQLGPDPARVEEQRAALASHCFTTEMEAHPMRRKKITRTVLIAAAMAAALSVGALAANGIVHIPFLTGGGITQGTDEEGIHYSEAARDAAATPLEARDGSLFLTTETGQILDLMGRFSEEDAYVYTYQDEEGYTHDIVVGGTVEDYGYFEFVYDAEGNSMGGAGAFPSGYSATNDPAWLADYKEAHGIPVIRENADPGTDTGVDTDPTAAFGSSQQPQWPEKEVTVENGRVLLTVNGETVDITGQFSEEQAYLYTVQDVDENGFHHVVLVGGTPEDIGTANYAYREDGARSTSSNVRPEKAPWLAAWLEEQGLF